MKLRTFDAHTYKREKSFSVLGAFFVNTIIGSQIAKPEEMNQNNAEGPHSFRIVACSISYNHPRYKGNGDTRCGGKSECQMSIDFNVVSHASIRVVVKALPALLSQPLRVDHTFKKDARSVLRVPCTAVKGLLNGKARVQSNAER